jgi:hypothetical protein
MVARESHLLFPVPLLHTPAEEVEVLTQAHPVPVVSVVVVPEVVQHQELPVYQIQEVVAVVPARM